MSSLVERLRARSENRPSYNLDFGSDEEPIVNKGSGKGKHNKLDENFEKFVRDDAKDDSCQACGESDDLIIGCGTCTYAFHLKCLLPPRKVVPDESWSCPECVSPLNEIEKILDWEMRPMTGETESGKQETKPKNVRHYLVKWKGLSYLHCTWIPEDEFKKACKTNPRMKTRLNKFKEQMDSINNSEDEYIAIRPEWTTVDRVLASRKTGDEREYFVKWKELGYEHCSWEYISDISAFQSQIERYKAIQYRRLRKSLGKTQNNDRDWMQSLNQDSKDLKNKQKEYQHYEQTPEFLSGTLHPYQLEGLNFLRYSWSKKTHVILADEMGLGKTIQSIAFVASLFKENLCPHLIVAPLSTLRNWEREFATWAPELNVIMYAGSAPARAIARQYEFFYPKEEKKGNKNKKILKDTPPSKQERIKFDVLLTSFEMINQDSTSLKAIEWESMIVDEGHRLKNKDSKLFLQLKLYSTKHRVLLTGTPLQNNLDELFMLMHFLDDGKFQSIEDFQKEFKDINQEEQIVRLHKMLAPHLLRRVKKDVMKDLPPKKELILRVDLSSKQKEYYKAILTRNYQILARRGGAQISLINVVMELRKLCCHAFMLEGVEPDIEPADTDEGLRKLLEFSGKMHLLDKMMVKLKERGHRVLIYSQFQHMLDLLEDYLCYKKWSYERIDGKISGAERQIRIDRYNAKNSTRFCFLLSTRAGGLGINLATADTVIIYDSDWNPHADLQAMARAHRLGQINKVMIYRLVTRGTIEERMMQLTKKKMILEHLVVGRLKAQQTVNQEELDDIIRYGSKELFVEEDDEGSKSRQIHYDDAAIERLLNRDQIVGDESSIDEEDDGLLRAFKVANFEYIDEIEAEAAAAKEEEAKKQSMKEKASASSLDKANYWDDLLRDRHEVHQIEEFTAMGKGKRSRKQMTTAEEDDLAGVQDVTSEDEDYSCEDDLSESEMTLPGNTSGRKGRFSRKRARADYVESLPLMKGEGKSLRILGFNQLQRANFLKMLMRFGFGDYDWKEFVPRLKGKSFEEIHEYGFLFMKHIDEGINDSPTFSDGVPKEGLRVDDLLVRLAHISLIKEKLKYLEDYPRSPLFPDDIKVCYPSLIGRMWKEEHDILLLKAILRHGYARWQTIVEDRNLGLYEVGRKELNLPVINGHCDTLDVAKGNPSHSDSTNYHQFKEVQRRIVEFIRKRYQLLEKILDLELCLAEDEKVNPGGPTSEDPEAGPIVNEVPCETAINSNTLMKELPNLEPIALASEGLPSNNYADRADMANLYNGLCRLSEANAVDSVEACLGDSSASSRLSKNMHELGTIYEDVHKTLAVKYLSASEEPEARKPVIIDNGFSSLLNSGSSDALEMNGKMEGSVGRSSEADMANGSMDE